MDFNELVLKRESCRNYTGEPVSRGDLEKITEAGRLSPSACNSQPWSFRVVAGEKREGVLRGVQFLGMNKFTDKAGALIVILGEKANYPERVGEAIGGRDFSSIDVGIAVANMALCATSLGLGTCIIGAFNEGRIKEAIGMDKKDKRRVRLVLAVGVPATAAPRPKTRKSADEVVEFLD